MDETTDDVERTRAHVHVTGRVQGVGFRATTRRHADQRGADGWVRNLDDGRVEAVFEGPPDVVEAMVEFCHDGSRAARVDDVTVETEPPEGLSGFDVRR
jgi:acylphosphatase